VQAGDGGAPPPVVVPAQTVPLQLPVQIQLPAAAAEEEEEDDDDDDDDEYPDLWEYETDGDEQGQGQEQEQLAPVPTVNINGKRAMRFEEVAVAPEGADAFDSLRRVVGQRMGARARTPEPGTPPRRALALAPGTPPKRARLTGEYSPTTIHAMPPRLVKRCSEDAEAEAQSKRARVEVGGADETP
jgi:hypothetical protein